jgi:hypothetical protein
MIVGVYLLCIIIGWGITRILCQVFNKPAMQIQPYKVGYSNFEFESIALMATCPRGSGLYT